MYYKLIIYGIVLPPLFLLAEIQYIHKGYFDLGTIHRLSDGSIIKTPYRMVTYEPNISYNNFSVISSMAVEFRLKDTNDILGSDFSFDLRELYIEWMTSLGDFSIGKQIISWGSASANNPTDNISPYNYYYLFSVGKERKEGILSLSSNIYWENLKLNTIFIPQHNTNVLPLNDPEFAISSPIVPKDEQIIQLDNPYEYGISMQFPINSIDITTSYFSGYDRIVSFFGANIWSDKNKDESTIMPDTVLSYRKTKVLGIGFSSFLNELSIKGDIGYFISDDETSTKGDSALYRDWNTGRQKIIDRCEERNEGLIQHPLFGPNLHCDEEPTFNNSFTIDNRAKYYQYVIEIEFPIIYDINLITQISQNKLIEIGEADSINVSTGTIMLDPADYFIPGLGSSNTFISSKSLSIVAQRPFYDMGLELRYTSIIDLDQRGSLHEVGIEYDIYENTKILIVANKIFDNKNVEMNPFTGMEEFSHIRIELKYYY